MQQPDVRLNGVFLEVGDKRIRIRRLQAMILEELLDHLGRCVRKSAIYEAVYASDPNGGPSSGVIEVMISQLRSLFRKHDLDLAIVTHHGIGWELRRCPGS